MTSNLEEGIKGQKILKILFYVFPLVMLSRSGFVNIYLFIFIIYSIYFFYKNKIKINFFFLDYLIFSVLLLLILSTIINFENFRFFFLLKSISYIKFGIFYLLVRNLFYYNIVNFPKIIIITSISTVFLSFDIFIQHIYGQDLFGYKPWHDRYAAIFDDEAIAGGYIQKFSFISISLITIINNFNFLKKILVTLLINILGLGILMSTDRMPLIIFLTQIVILIFLIKNLRLFYLINLIILLSLIFLLIQNNKIINERYEFLSIINNLTINKKIEVEKNKNINSIAKEFINSTEYSKIFYTGYYIWKINPILGTGVKSFNLSCSQAAKTNNQLLCAPHAHNLYLEILVNIGIIGIIILIIYIFNILKESKKILFRENNSIYLYLLIIFIAELLPFRSYGSIFTTVNGTMFWYLLALTSIIKFKKY
jgi:hypothetical protein